MAQPTPTKIVIGGEYLCELKKSAQIKYRQGGLFSRFKGIPIFSDESVPTDCCDVFDQFGRRMARFRLDGSVEKPNES